MPCDDWARVPWFDAVNHHRFILHGVGYRQRYTAAWPNKTPHALTSDDYLSAEILTGHALMAQVPSFDREAVRKYWLAQDVARRLALRKIERVEIDRDNMHRLTVTWDDGTQGCSPEAWRQRIGGMCGTRGEAHVDVECNDRVFSLACAPVAGAGHMNLYGRDIKTGGGRVGQRAGAASCSDRAEGDRAEGDREDVGASRRERVVDRPMTKPEVTVPVM